MYESYHFRIIIVIFICISWLRVRKHQDLPHVGGNSMQTGLHGITNWVYKRVYQYLYMTIIIVFV